MRGVNPPFGPTESRESGRTAVTFLRSRSVGGWIETCPDASTLVAATTSSDATFVTMRAVADPLLNGRISTWGVTGSTTATTSRPPEVEPDAVSVDPSIRTSEEAEVTDAMRSSLATVIWMSSSLTDTLFDPTSTSLLSLTFDKICEIAVFVTTKAETGLGNFSEI